MKIENRTKESTWHQTMEDGKQLIDNFNMDQSVICYIVSSDLYVCKMY